MKFDFKKNGSKSLVRTGSVIAGGIGANILQNVSPPQFKKFAAPAALALGIVAQMVDNEHVQSVGMGLAGMGAINTLTEHVVPKVPQAAMIAPQMANVGVNGLGYIEDEMDLLGIELAGNYDDDLDDEFDDIELEGLGYTDEFTDYEDMTDEDDLDDDELDGLPEQEGGFDNLI